MLLDLYDEFLAKTGPDRIQKILARTELFRMVRDVPGDIVECGVFRGSGLYTWAKLRQIFGPLSDDRIVGFDFFEAEREIEFARKEDADVLDAHDAGWATRANIQENLKAMGVTFPVELIAGNVVETTAAYPKDNMGFRIRLLYLDVDNYEGSKAILENLYPYVVKGGLVVFDEYARRSYGESDAVDEFLSDKRVSLQAIPWANTPSAYFVKP